MSEIEKGGVATVVTVFWWNAPACLFTVNSDASPSAVSII